MSQKCPTKVLSGFLVRHLPTSPFFKLVCFTSVVRFFPRTKYFHLWNTYFVRAAWYSFQTTIQPLLLQNQMLPPVYFSLFPPPLLLPLLIALQHYFTEALTIIHNEETQSNHFGRSVNVSIEVYTVHYCHPSDESKQLLDFHSFMSDDTTQMASTVFFHMDMLIQKLMDSKIISKMEGFSPILMGLPSITSVLLQYISCLCW